MSRQLRAHDAAAVAIDSKSWPFDIRLRPWSSALIYVCYHCATSPVVAGAIRTRKWPLSRVFVGFNRQYVRSGHYGEVWHFFGPVGFVLSLAPFPPHWPLLIFGVARFDLHQRRLNNDC